MSSNIKPKTSVLAIFFAATTLTLQPTAVVGAEAQGNRGDVEASRILKDVSYGPYGVRNLMDFYLPVPGVDAVAARPLVICIHGGGWARGDKDDYADYRNGRVNGVMCTSQLGGIRMSHREDFAFLWLRGE